LGYLFLGIWLYAGFLYLLVRQPNIKFKILNFVKCALILITPYLFWGVILLVTGGIGKFFFDNYTFNTNYYSQFQSEPHFLYIQNGPIESLALIAKRFANGLEAATKNPLSPETYQAFFSLLAVLALICYWGYRKQAFKLIIFIPVIILLNPRAGIGQSWEVATYLGGPFIVVSFFAAAVVLIKAFAYLNQNKEAYVLRTVLYLLLPFTMFAWFSAISFSANTYFGYFTQSSLNLVSREETPTAKIVNTLTTKEDYAWVVPFDLETPIFQKARQASYHYFLAPWITACGDCKKRILEDLATNKPKIIVWSKNKSLWDQKMDSAASDILDYIKKNYFTVGNSRKQLLDNFYFLRDKEDSIRSELQAKGYT
jgi:hypothetical protein